MKNYNDKIHTIGRIGLVIGLAFMFGIPTIIGLTYHIMPSFSDIIGIGGGLFAVFAPLAIIEFLSYTPILGSATYITFLTGNVLNLKLPCAIKAMEQAEALQGTEKGDTIGAMAVSASSIMTTIVIAVGVLLLVPLQPILTTPALKTATGYMLPAMFGSLFFGMFTGSNRVGGYTAKGKNWVIVPALVVVSFLHFSGIYNFSMNTGLAVIIAIVLIAISAPLMVKAGIIKMIPIEDAKPAEEKKEEPKE